MNDMQVGPRIFFFPVSEPHRERDHVGWAVSPVPFTTARVKAGVEVTGGKDWAAAAAACRKRARGATHRPSQHSLVAK